MRSATVIRDQPSATGDCDWIDVVNNWRDADATWLQERSIVRISTTPQAESTNIANTSEGRVFYSIGDKVLYLSTTGVAPFAKVFASTKLRIDESAPGFITVGITGFESAGITFNTTNGAVVIGNLTLTNIVGTSVSAPTATFGALTVNGTGGITINTDGSHTTHITTGVQGLLFDSSISATGFVRGAQAEFSSLLVSGGSTLTTVTVDTLTAGTAVIAPQVHAAASSDLTIAAQSGQAVRFTSPTVAGANFYYGAGTSIRLGWVVVSNTDPGLANVPEGTIWINPSFS